MMSERSLDDNFTQEMSSESKPLQLVSQTGEIPPLCFEDFIPVGPDDPFMLTLLREAFPIRANLTGSRLLSGNRVVADKSAEEDSVKHLTTDDLSTIKDNILSWMKDIDHELLKSDIDPSLLDSFVMDVVEKARIALLSAEEGRYFIPTKDETAEDRAAVFMAHYVKNSIKTRFGQ